MVPEGWIQVPIGELVKQVVKPVSVDPGQTYHEIGVRSHGKGIFYKEPVTGRQIGNKRVFWVVPDCLVFNIIFAWEQAVARTTDQDVGKIASHRFPMYRPIADHADVDYLMYLFKTPYGKHLLGLASPGGAGRNKTLGQRAFRKIAVPVPSLPEQRRIVAMLRTWDRAITTVERLADENRRLLQASTERLLDRHERPRTSSPARWRDVVLGDIADVYMSNVDKKTESGGIPVRLCNYTDVYYKSHITGDLDLMAATATPSQVAKFTLRSGDVIITKDSETRSDIGVATFVPQDLDGVVCGYHLALIRPRAGEADGEFLRYLFGLKKTQRYFFKHANGAIRFGLGRRDIKALPIRLPPLEEQQAIARQLRVFECNVQNIHEQLSRLRSERLALMQQLLTGKRRVTLKGAA